MRPSKDVPFYHERSDMFPILAQSAEIVKTSPHISSREAILSDDELIYTVTTSFADKQAWLLHKYELMATDVIMFINRNSYCLENNISVVREWSQDSGPKHLADDSNLDQYARLFFTIKSLNSKNGSGPFLVTFDIESVDNIIPSIGNMYTVSCDLSPDYNGTVNCTASTIDTITVSYATEPGVFTPISSEFENAISIITMNP
jgi:hypothetical protein